MLCQVVGCYCDPEQECRAHIKTIKVRMDEAQELLVGLEYVLEKREVEGIV